MATAVQKKKVIVIDKDLDDHNDLATNISEGFRAGPRWCDVVILIQGDRFYSCKGILASVSPYFRQLFSTDFKDTCQREVRLEGFTAVGFGSIWNYIHGTRMEVEGEEGVLTILQDAHFLGLKRLCNKMSETIKGLLNHDNALRILCTAELCNDKDLREAAIGFISVRFSQVIRTNDFLSVSFETIASLLDRDELGVSSEKEVYEATRKWLGHDESRRRYLRDLLDKIRLPLLPPEYLKSVVLKDPFIRGDSRCLDAVTDAKDYHIPELRHTVPKEKSRPRSPVVKEAWCLGKKDTESSIYRFNHINWNMEEITHYPYSEKRFARAFAGIGRKLFLTGFGEMMIFDIGKRKWKEGPSPPEPIGMPATAASPGSLSVCGGRDRTNAHRKWAFQFQVGSGRWVRLSDMRHDRYGAGACHRDACLHVIGGFPNKKKHERLDLRTPEWQELRDLPQGRENLALLCRDGDLVAAGGWDGGEEKQEVYVYDRRGNAWWEMPSMAERRGRHGLAAVDGKLYAVGGTENSSVELFESGWKVVKRYDMTTCERACQMIS